MGAHILVIEDHPANLQLMEYLLHTFGHSVETAGTGEEGLARAGMSRYDLILCDVQLPGMDGYRVVGELKASDRTRPIPTIAVTAYAMAGDKQRLLAAGFDGYIAKPITPETFVQDIEAFLPREAHGSRAAVSAPSKGTPRRRRSARRVRVLVVDDSRVNQGVMRGILEPHGYDVRLASSVASALEAFSSDHPDLILSDIHMPGDDGFALLREVQAREVGEGGDPTPVAFVSSTMWARADQERALAAGAVDFIVRPIGPEALLARVEQVLHAAGSNGRRR